MNMYVSSVCSTAYPYYKLSDVFNDLLDWKEYIWLNKINIKIGTNFFEIFGHFDVVYFFK